MGLDEILVGRDVLENLGTNGISVLVVIEIGQESTPRRLRYADNRDCNQRDLVMDIGDNWKVIRMQVPLSYDTRARNEKG